MEKQIHVDTFYRFMSSIYGVTLSILDEAGGLKERYSTNPQSVEYILSLSNLKERIFSLCNQSQSSQVTSSEFGQLWAGIPVLEGNSVVQLILLGPVFTSGGSTSLMLDYIRSYNTSLTSRENLLNALNHTPVCTYAEFTRLVAVVYAFTYGKELVTSELPISGLTNHAAFTVPDLFEDESSVVREGKAINPTIALEQQLLDCVQEGNLEKLKRLLKTSNYGKIHFLSLPDPIRQQKDMFIGLIAQVVSATIRSGLNPEIAYSLYDSYIQQVEVMGNMLPIISLTREMLYDFTNRMGRLKRTSQYSKLINECCNYIHEHVYEALRLTDVAEFSGHNAHYISQKFREETGSSINDFIRSAKIAEAKSLLKYSTLSLSGISEQLSFSSQSFFTSVFRQAIGVTPGQFREDAEF